MEQQRKIEPTIHIGDLLYYPIEDAAEYINTSIHTLRRETYVKNIRYLNHPRGLMFLPEWLDEWILRKTMEPKKQKR